jgi:hypothetical protein
VIIFNFNVIARPAELIGQRQPCTEGRHIWNMFHDKELGRICLICEDDYSPETFEQWLKRESFKPAMYEMVDFSDPVLKAEKVKTLSALWGKTHWYVDNDPRTCAETLKLGIPTLVVANPFIIRPEWDKERDIKAWDLLVDEMDAQAIKEANKTWREL